MSCFRERQVDAGVALDLAGAGEVADAAVEQHDAGDRQRHRGLHVLLGGVGRSGTQELSAPIPAPIPNAPATGATYSHFVAMIILQEEPTKRGGTGSKGTRS